MSEVQRVYEELVELQNTTHWANARDAKHYALSSVTHAFGKKLTYVPIDDVFSRETRDLSYPPVFEEFGLLDETKFASRGVSTGIDATNVCLFKRIG